MFSRALPLLFATIALFALLGVANARPTEESLESRDWSNSKRMAAGLAPRAPRTARTRPRPSATVSKRAAASPTPSQSTVQTFSGRIAIRSNQFVGYVSGGSPARVDVQGKYGGDLQVKFTTNTATSYPVNLEATNGGFSPAWIGGSGNMYLSAHSSAIVPIKNVPATLAYQKPSLEGASAIWVFDNESHQLTPRWTNIDGGAPNVVIGYNWQSNELFLTGDLAVYNAATGSKAIAVEFYLSN